MASADHPINHAAPPHNFNEEEDLLDEDDDEESFDHDEDDDASLAAVDRLPSDAAALDQVTIAVPGISEPQLILHHHHHHPQPHPESVAVVKRAMPPDESRKLFQRLWTDEDEIELLQGFLDYTTLRCGPHSSSQHHHDTTAFYDQIKSRFQLDFNKNQLVEKLRRLKKKYRNVISKFGSGKDYTFKSPHDQATFEISSKIWGSTALVNVPSAFPPTPPATAPVDEEDDDFNNPNFANYQSPKPNGIDINSKTPQPRKRSRAGVVKLEDRQQHVPNSSNIHSFQPLSAATAVPPMASPGLGMGMGMGMGMNMGMNMGMGIPGSMSSVIEETVKSCLSPIFKELLSNSMGSAQNPHGVSCGQGLELARCPLPFCFAGAMGSGSDKPANTRWRKQQILELEVFSKRLELVQEQIREQLEELRSMGN